MHLAIQLDQGPMKDWIARAGRHHARQGSAAGRLGARVLVGGRPAPGAASTKSATKTPTKPDRD